MGARCNFIFKDSQEGPYVALYSHWGADSWGLDLAKAIDKARPRWEDPSYAVRIMVSQLIGANWDDPLSYGLYALTKQDLDKAHYLDEPIIIDMVKQEVNGHSFQMFIDYQYELEENHTFA